MVVRAPCEYRTSGIGGQCSNLQVGESFNIISQCSKNVTTHNKRVLRGNESERLGQGADRNFDKAAGLAECVVEVGPNKEKC